jgi:hypothetical protein
MKQIWRCVRHNNNIRPKRSAWLSSFRVDDFVFKHLAKKKEQKSWASLLQGLPSFFTVQIWERGFASIKTHALIHYFNALKLYSGTNIKSTAKCVVG